MKVRNLILALAASAAMVAPVLALPVVAWVPPYFISTCKNSLQASWSYNGKNYGMKDGLTLLNLQFWSPTNSGALTRAYGSNSPSNSDIDWFVKWGHDNGIKVLLCIFNPPESGDKWNWAAAKAAFKTNRTGFIKQILSEIDQRNLDGADIDFECNESNCNSDKNDYVAFMRALRDSLDRRGKTLTYASFANQYNGPNWDWWNDLDGLVDAYATMGYDWSSYNKDYQTQVNHAPTPRKMMIGMPSYSSWQGAGVLRQLQWVTENGNVGVAIWDATLRHWDTQAETDWMSGQVWYVLSQIKKNGDNGPYKITANASHGSVSLNPSKAEYAKNEQVVATAVPDAGWFFAGWSAAAGDTARTKTLTMTSDVALEPVFAPEGELVKNGNFAGAENWNLTVHSGAAAEGSVSDGRYELRIENGGADTWRVGLAQTGIVLAAGKTYTLEFRASASEPVTVNAGVGQSSGDYETYVLEATSLTSSAKKFSYTFVASETNANARVLFDCGNVSPTTISISDVSLRLGEGTGPDPEEDPASIARIAAHASWSLSLSGAELSLSGVRGEAELYDLRGRRAMTALPEGGRATFDLSALPRGNYVVRADGISRTVSRR